MQFLLINTLSILSLAFISSRAAWWGRGRARALQIGGTCHSPLRTMTFYQAATPLSTPGCCDKGRHGNNINNNKKEFTISGHVFHCLMTFKSQRRLRRPRACCAEGQQQQQRRRQRLRQKHGAFIPRFAFCFD